MTGSVSVNVPVCYRGGLGRGPTNKLFLLFLGMQAFKAHL